MRKVLFLLILLVAGFLIYDLATLPYSQFTNYLWGQFTGKLILLILLLGVAYFLVRPKAQR